MNAEVVQWSYVVSGHLSRYEPSTLREVTFSPIELEVIKNVRDASVSSMGIDHDRHGISVRIFQIQKDDNES